MKEISKEELKQMPYGTKYIVYNPLTDTTRESVLDKNSIVFSKYCYSGLKFYLEN